MKPRRFDALFVDFYGTLVTGDREAVERTCARVVADLGLPISARALAVDWGRRFFNAIEASNGHGFLTLFACECVTLCETVAPWTTDFDPEPYARMLKDYWSDPPEAPNARAGLAEIDLPICVVSNADTEDILLAIERRGFRVDAVITSEDARSYKPHRGIFDLALARLGVRPERVLHAGDSLHSDVGGAGPLGMTTCWVCYADRILDVGDARPHHQVGSIGELRALL